MKADLHGAPRRIFALRAFEIGNYQASPRFEHTGDFRKPQSLQVIRQMMHHKGSEHNIERLIGEIEVLDHPDLKNGGQVVPSRFRAGTGDLLCTRIDAVGTARLADALLDFNRQRSSTAAHIQHLISGLNVGQVDGSLPNLPHLATENEGVETRPSSRRATRC